MIWQQALLDKISNSPNTKVEISISELTMAASKLVNIVCEQGHSFVITRRGQRIAVLGPYTDNQSDGIYGQS